MNKRSPTLKVGHNDGPQIHARKSKKRSGRRNTPAVEAWCDDGRISVESMEDQVPGMEYAPMFWQHHGVPQPQPVPAHNGQRLFTAMSDPGVCGYPAVPMTYAMEPVSLPSMYRMYQPVPRVNYGPFRNRTRPSMTRNHIVQNSETLTNGYSSLENGFNGLAPTPYRNGDYASLPPGGNVDDKDGVDDLNSEHRRYSDPGLGPADVDDEKSDDSDSVESSGSSITTVGRSNKLVLTLIEQMTKMRESNSQMFKELHQVKSELETVRTELNHLKQNTPSDYQPGMLSDIVREIREASLAREDATISKVKLMIDNRTSHKLDELELLKTQIGKLAKEKTANEQRVAKLESEIATLKQHVNIENREIAAFEEENLALRRDLQEARASRALAESHATKCVTDAAVARPATPEPFHTPRISSTPIHTARNTLPDDPSQSVDSLRSTDVHHDADESDVVAHPVEASGQDHTVEDNDKPETNRDEGQKDKETLTIPKKVDPQVEEVPNGDDVDLVTESSVKERLLSLFTDGFGPRKEGDSEQGDQKNETCRKNGDESSDNCGCTNWSITDIPDVIVVGGNSVVQKDLCSTNILTSRVLKAHSRATYTTAFI